METTIDQVGRIVVPGSPSDRTARLERHGGRLVTVADTVVTDDDVFGLLDSFRL